MPDADYLLSDLLLNAAEKYPDRAALIFPDSQLSYSELAALSQTRSSNGRAWFEAWRACWNSSDKQT